VRLTTRSEYALLALIHLARHGAEDFVAARTISGAKGIPLAFLEQILRALKQARLVTSAKGQHGGFRLACPANCITIAEVIRLCDGAIAPTQSVSEYFYEPTPIGEESKLVSLFRTIRDYTAHTLEKTTLADVI